MADLPAAAPAVTKHCWTCRAPTEHRLVPGLSRALYQCVQRCGAAAREVTPQQLIGPTVEAAEEAELSICRNRKAAVERDRQALAATRIRPITRITPKETTTTMSNPLQEAIDAAVTAAVAPVKKELADALEEIRELSKKGVTLADLDKAIDSSVERALESQAGDVVQRSLLQMLARPAAGDGASGRRKRPTEAATPGESCRHKNFMRKCASCQKRHAGKED